MKRRYEYPGEGVGGLKQVLRNAIKSLLKSKNTRKYAQIMSGNR